MARSTPPTQTDGIVALAAMLGFVLFPAAALLWLRSHRGQIQYVPFEHAFTARPALMRAMLLPHGYWQLTPPSPPGGVTPTTNRAAAFAPLYNGLRGVESLPFAALPFVKALLLAASTEAVGSCDAKLGLFAFALGGSLLLRVLLRPLRVGIAATGGAASEAATLLMMVAAWRGEAGAAVTLAAAAGLFAAACGLSGAIMTWKFQARWVAAEEQGRRGGGTNKGEGVDAPLLTIASPVGGDHLARIPPAGAASGVVSAHSATSHSSADPVQAEVAAPAIPAARPPPSNSKPAVANPLLSQVPGPSPPPRRR